MPDEYDRLPTFDENKGELLGPKGEDYVVLSAEALRNINQEEESILHSGSNVIWYNAGRAVGRSDGKKYAPLMQEMDLDRFASYLKMTYMRYGWGLIEYSITDFDSGMILFTVRDSPLVKGIRSKEPRCWFVKGFAEGLTSELLGVQTVAKEVKCQAVGADRCEFDLSWKATGT